MTDRNAGGAPSTATRAAFPFGQVVNYVPGRVLIKIARSLYSLNADIRLRCNICRNGPLPEVSNSLFHDLVGQCEEFIWNVKAERLGGLEVDDEIKFGRLLDRQLAGLCSA
jgi:hypothetical protein